jgi:hypothetical protein
MMAAAEGKSPFRVDIQSLDELRPGQSNGLDVICDGILSGSPFVYPAESDVLENVEAVP